MAFSMVFVTLLAASFGFLHRCFPEEPPLSWGYSHESATSRNPTERRFACLNLAWFCWLVDIVKTLYQTAWKYLPLKAHCVSCYSCNCKIMLESIFSSPRLSDFGMRNSLIMAMEPPFTVIFYPTLFFKSKSNQMSKLRPVFRKY